MFARAGSGSICSPSEPCRMDAPVQHFSGPDGTYDGGQKPFTCAPLRAWCARDSQLLVCRLCAFASGSRAVAYAKLPRGLLGCAACQEGALGCAACRYSGDNMTLAGGRRNVALERLIPRLADAHLRTW